MLNLRILLQPMGPIDWFSRRSAELPASIIWIGRDCGGGPPLPVVADVEIKISEIWVAEYVVRHRKLHREFCDARRS
jgi:hypothetical protein